MCKKFTIYGERCSGTNYLEQMIQNNFNISVTWDYGWKHYFGFYNFIKSAEEDDTLFICIVRNPFDWIHSFFKSQHHLIHTDNFEEFVKRPIVSLNDSTIIEEDKNYLTGKYYNNIFELRFYKNYYLLNILPKKVKNYIFIRYEDLLNDHINVMSNIQEIFNLSLKNEQITNVSYYKSIENSLFSKKKYTMSLYNKILLIKNLNKKQECKLKYI